jgi:cytosine/adenosine deaminase-related metal-dependent hydrolase
LVIPVDGPPIDGGVVTIAGGTIREVGPASDVPATDLGDVALVPGFVNAHTHLEFSGLEFPLGPPGESLPSWIHRVVGLRRATDDTRQSWVRTGLRQLVRHGVTSAGEIATWDWPAGDIATPIPLVVFHEAIGLTPERSAAELARARSFLGGPITPGIVRGLSPHAPYSVHPRFLDELIDLAITRNAPVAMHLAESIEELLLLSEGRGPFCTLLEELGAWHADAFPGGRRPLDYLMSLALAPRALVIHCNYLSEDEWRFIAGHRNRLTVVHCPRTHARFGHDRWPLARTLALGVPLAIGTDSQASNPNLSVLEELRALARIHADVSPATLLRLGTVAGQAALFPDLPSHGLAPGAPADMAAVALSPAPASDPCERVLTGGSVVLTVSRGRVIDAQYAFTPDSVIQRSASRERQP